MVEGCFVHYQKSHIGFSDNRRCSGFSIDEGYLPEKVALRQLSDDFPVFLYAGLALYDKNELPPWFPLLNQDPVLSLPAPDLYV